MKQFFTFSYSSFFDSIFIFCANITNEQSVKGITVCIFLGTVEFYNYSDWAKSTHKLTSLNMASGR